MSGAKRFLFIAIWTVVFFALPAFLIGGLLALLYIPSAADPPTEMGFMGTMCMSPLAALVGLFLGVRRKLPGTK